METGEVVGSVEPDLPREISVGGLGGRRRQGDKRNLGAWIRGKSKRME